MNLAAKIAFPVSALVVVGLVALAVPGIGSAFNGKPTLTRVNLDDFPEDVQTLLTTTGLGDFELSSTTHIGADAEYVSAVTAWPWELPEGMHLPKSRDVPDTPGGHWEGMGVKGAFQKYSALILGAVRGGDLTSDQEDRFLDELEDCARTLLTIGLLKDRDYIDRTIAPLRASAEGSATRMAAARS